MECEVCPRRRIPKPKFPLFHAMSSSALLLRLYRKACGHHGMSRAEKTKSAFYLSMESEVLRSGLVPKRGNKSLSRSRHVAALSCSSRKVPLFARHGSRGCIKSSILAVGVVSFIPQLPVLFTKTLWLPLHEEDSSSKNKKHQNHVVICCLEQDVDLWTSKAKVDRTMSVPGSLVALYQS